MPDLPTSYCLPKLHALAHSQDENFLTASFAHILSVYLESEPSCAASLLRYLFPSDFVLDEMSLATISVHTQYTTEFGVPDVVIRGLDSILYIEAKVDSGFGDNQLERYTKALTSEREAHKYLVTLTRYAVDCGVNKKVRNLRWYELADRFELLQPVTDVGAYLQAEFLELLRHRGVTMETVSWELKEGVRSFRSLVDMIGEALRLHDIAIHQKSGAWNYYGYYVAEGGMFVGFYLDEPTVVVVETTRQTTKADDFEPEVGQFENGKWTNSVELSSESVHFFSRSRASQMQFLEAWIGDSVDFGQKVLG